MSGSVTHRRMVLLLAVCCSMLAVPSAASAQGTISAVKGSDRFASNALDAYASGLSGALFEYTPTTDPGFLTPTPFPAVTGVTGLATAPNVPAGTYFVRERAVPIGFAHLGPIQGLAFDPASNTPAGQSPYISTVQVVNGQTTNAFPNRVPGVGAPAQPPTVPGSPFINTRDNALTPVGCGLKMQLVLDRSGSIFPNRFAYNAAVNNFIDTLAGSPTQLAITSFNRGVNAGAQGGVAAQPPLSLAVPANVTTLKNKVTQIYQFPQSGTDWDSALQDAANRAEFTPTSISPTAKADMVVFITDGNPTTSQAPGSDGGTNVDLTDLTYGMASANLVKSQVAHGTVGTKLLAIGVGDVTEENLRVITGPNPEVSADPDYVVTDIANLLGTLRRIAVSACVVPPPPPPPPPVVAPPPVAPPVAAPVAAPGTARLRGETGCISRTSQVVVTGTRIERVTFSIVGQDRKTVYKPDSRGRFTYTVRRVSLKTGSRNRVRAVVRFVNNSRRPVELKLRLIKCRRAVAPAFTG
ncbi:MAG: hypothetical protein QOJ46_1034 [bacterium]